MSLRCLDIQYCHDHMIVSCLSPFKRVKLTCTNSSTNVLSIKYCVWSRFKKIRLGLSCVNSHHVLVHATMYSDKLKSYITFTMWFHIILSLCLACLKETLWLFCSQGQEWPQTDVSHATFPTNIRDIDERTYVKFTLFTSVCCLIANVKHIGKLTDSFQRFSPASPPWRWPASAEPQFAHKAETIGEGKGQNQAQGQRQC